LLVPSLTLYTPKMRLLRGCLVRLLWIALLGGTLAYAIAILTAPWALNIGGGFTPLLTWFGAGTLVTKEGTSYPLFLYFHPSSNIAALNPQVGPRPRGPVTGFACLCTPQRGANQNELLLLRGDLYGGGWFNTENSRIQVRLGERSFVNLGQRLGFFNLTGNWQGRDLVMADREVYSGVFRSGLRIDHASVTLHPSGFWLTCSSACSTAN